MQLQTHVNISLRTHGNHWALRCSQELCWVAERVKTIENKGITFMAIEMNAAGSNVIATEVLADGP